MINLVSRYRVYMRCQKCLFISNFKNCTIPESKNCRFNDYFWTEKKN